MISSSASQPPMDLLATGPTGIVNIIRNDNQSTVEKTDIGEIFAVDNSNYTVYYVESSTVFGMPLRNTELVFVSLFKFITMFVATAFNLSMQPVLNYCICNSIKCLIF